jgi:predicted outer membrane repeat protein
MSQTCSGSVISPCHVRSQRGLIALLVGLALSVGVSLGAQAAATWTVCASGCDYSSIKAAIAAPTTLDGDTLAIAAGTYTEPGILVNKSLTLQGKSAATTIVQAAASKGTATDRMFTVPAGVTVTLQNLTVRYGRPTGAGGGLANFGTLTLIRSTIHSNAATQFSQTPGGGLANFSTLTLTRSTVRNNTAGQGGGIYNEGTLTLTRSTVRNNTARRPGGGLYNREGHHVTLTTSTVSGNATRSTGGGLCCDGGFTLTNSTVSGNTAAGGGGGLYNAFGTVTLTSSIVANNPDGGDCFIVDTGGELIISHGYNLDSDRSCLPFAGTDQPGVDPLLGPLQDNGGPTLTHALLPGSPAIDAIPWGTNGCGTTHLADQCGQPRPQPPGGACDIGAYEVEVDG